MRGNWDRGSWWGGGGGHGLLGVHWHLQHMDYNAGFMMKGPERRGHIRDRSPLVVGLRRSNHGPRSPVQLVTCPGQRSDVHVFRISDREPWHSHLGVPAGPGMTDSLLPHLPYGSPLDLHPTSPHCTPEKLVTASTCHSLLSQAMSAISFIFKSSSEKLGIHRPRIGGE